MFRQTKELVHGGPEDRLLSTIHCSIVRAITAHRVKGYTMLQQQIAAKPSNYAVASLPFLEFRAVEVGRWGVSRCVVVCKQLDGSRTGYPSRSQESLPTVTSTNNNLQQLSHLTSNNSTTTLQSRQLSSLRYHARRDMDFAHRGAISRSRFSFKS